MVIQNINSKLNFGNVNMPIIQNLSHLKATPFPSKKHLLILMFFQIHGRKSRHIFMYTTLICLMLSYRIPVVNIMAKLLMDNKTLKTL